MLKKLISSLLIVILILMYMPVVQITDWLTSNAATTVWEYNYNGGAQNFSAPVKGIYQIDAYGAQGGNTSGASGGAGSYTTGRILLSKNQSLSVYVGGQNGYNGGGAGNTYQAVGGGSTDIRLNGNAVGNRILVAAGGGGAYTQINYHQHEGDGSSETACRTERVLCRRTAITFTPVTDAGHWIDYVDAYFEHSICGKGTEYEAKGRYFYGDATGAAKWDAINGYHFYYQINCGKTEGVTIDSYTNIAGQAAETSNGAIQTGSLGGGGGLYGGVTNYAGTNYANPSYFSNIGATIGAKTGNGYVKITLISAFPEVSLSANTTSLTSGNVILTANAVDNIVGLTAAPYSWNGAARVNQNTCVITKNGTYTVNVVNNQNNTAEASIQVTNIDKLKPVIGNVVQNISANKKQTTLTITATDNATSEYAASGINGYAITTSNTIPTNFQASNVFNVTKNGTYYLWARDAVGNISNAYSVLVKDIEIDIVGTITWNDQNNRYNSRKTSNISLYRKIGENGVEERVSTVAITAGQTNYSFQTRECNNAGNAYIFRIAQDAMPGYNTVYVGNNTASSQTQNITIAINNNLIIPTYNSEITYTPVETYNNQYLKNGKIKLKAIVENTNNTTYPELGLNNGIVTLNIDNAISLDTNTLKITYTDTIGTKRPITAYILNGNILTIDFGENRISKVKDKIEIEVIGTATQIKEYKSTIQLTGNLRAYNGENTNINLGEITKTEKKLKVGNQMPKAKLQIRKQDSITENKLTDAIFTLYEWNGVKYVEKETITDANKDGIYESKEYEWNVTTKGKYKVVETGIPNNHKDLQFSMEYTINQLKQENYIITPDYDNSEYKIKYELRNPDDFDNTNKIVENEPYKLKAEIEKIDAQTKNQIVSNTEFTIFEWNKETNKYEEYTSYINNQKVKMERQENGKYISKEWLYYTPKNEGKYRIIETTAPQGYYANVEKNGQKVVYDINILEIIQTGNYNNQEVTNESTLKIGNNEQNKLENSRVNATLNIKVVEKDEQEEPIVTGAKYGIYALEEIKHADGITTNYNGEAGVLYKKDELIDAKIVDSQGNINFSGLECGKYYVKMIEAPIGYVLDENKYKVDFSYQGEQKKHLEISAKLNIEIKRINIKGTITWDDQENRYNSRIGTTLHIYRKIGISEQEEKIADIIIQEGQTDYILETKVCNNDGNLYIYRVEQDNVPGYETLYDGNNVSSIQVQEVVININNNLILPKYTSKVDVKPIDSFEEKILKNSQVKIIATVQADTKNRENLGIHEAEATLKIDNKFQINKNNIIVIYDNGNGNITNISDFSIKGNTISTYLGNNESDISTAGSKLTIEVEGRVNQLEEHNTSIDVEGKLRDFKGENTNIDLGIVTQKQIQNNVEYQTPKAKLQIRKQDSIAENKLTDATFTLYEWNGINYVEKEQINDTNSDGIYESKEYEWNKTTEGKYKVVETGIPNNHKDLKFSMEYTIDQLKQENYIITPDYDNTEYKIQYKLRNPDDFDSTNTIVENEPYKLKAQIEKIDSETNKQIVSDTEFTIYEWNNQSSQYEEYISYINNETVKMERQENGKYISEEWLYYTEKNEGKYRIIETKAPQGYYANVDENGQKVAYDINILEIIQTGNYNNQEVENESILKIGNNEQNKLENTRVDATLNVIVVDKETKGEAQANSTLQGAKYGIYALEEIKHVDGITSRYENEPGVLYKKDELITTRNTNEEGKMSFENLECGKYYIKMLEPSVGYLLDENKYQVDFTYQQENQKHLELTGKLEMEVKKQAFQLNKLKENGEVLSNAGFSIYLISDLSIVKEHKITRASNNTYYLNDEQAKNSEQLKGKQNEDGTYFIADLINYYYKINFTEENKSTLPGDSKVYHPYKLEKEKYVKDHNTNVEGEEILEIRTDNNGYMKSPELAYGEYIVIETSVPREQQEVQSFVVIVDKDSREAQELRYIIDKDFKTRLKIYTKDVNTRNLIQDKDVYYVIKNEETGQYMTKQIWTGVKYEEQGTLENPFISKAEGYFITPMELPIGKYTLEEVKAPIGYVVSGKEGYAQNNEIISTPQEKIKIEIASNAVYYMDHYLKSNIVVVEQENEEVLGSITIKSIGEYLNKVETIKNENNNYQFSYETRAVPNIEYDIYAKEDILSQDNHKILRYKKDEKIATVITNENGEVTLNNLPQGKYYIKETKVPEGFALNQEIQEVEIEYQNQETPVIFKIINSQEQRQKVNINIKNIDEQTKEKIVGGTYEIYTTEEIKYRDEKGEEKRILKGTLIYTINGDENGEIKYAKELNVDLPIGNYVIKEIEAPQGYIKIEDIEIIAVPKSGEKEIKIEKVQERQKTQLKITNIEEEKTIVGAKVKVEDVEGNVIAQIESLGELNKVEGLSTKKTYYLKTEKPANGYVTNEPIEFMIEEDGKLQIDDKHYDPQEINTSVIISEKTKLNVNFYHEEEQIKGTKISIKEENGNIIASTKEEKVTLTRTNKLQETLKIEETEEGYYIEKLPIGNYVLVQEEIPYEEGYVEKKEVDIEIKDTPKLQEYKVEQEISKVKLQIQDKETQEKIKGALIQIQNAEGKIVATTKEEQNTLKIEETEEGYYVEKLPIGKYEILEIEPKGYKAIEKQKIEIKDTKEVQEINLLTRKLIFDVELDKKLKNIVVDGKKTNVEGTNDILKVEIKERKIKTTNLELEYKITVKNKGEIEATIEKILDQIPQGLSYKETANSKWKVNKQKAIYNEKIILKPGEEKEIEITLTWDNSPTNFEEKRNTAQLLEVKNEYGYKNANQSNGTDSASIVISVGTGLEEKVTLIRIIIIALTACMTICLLASIELLILKKKEH